MCTHGYTGICVHMSILPYVYTWVYWHMCTHEYTGICVHMSIPAYVYIDVDSLSPDYSYSITTILGATDSVVMSDEMLLAGDHVCDHLCTCTCMCTYVYACIGMFTLTCVCTHTWTLYERESSHLYSVALRRHETQPGASPSPDCSWYKPTSTVSCIKTSIFHMYTLYIYVLWHMHTSF